MFRLILRVSLCEPPRCVFVLFVLFDFVPFVGACDFRFTVAFVPDVIIKFLWLPKYPAITFG
jgi:hypothetical protein